MHSCFTFPADNAWGEWAIHRLYLPLRPSTARVLDQSSARDQSRPGFDPAEAPTRANAPGCPSKNGRALVRNVDAAESEIERTTVANLREVYRLPDASQNGQRENNAPETLAAGGERPDELWRAVAWTLLIVLVAETFVANRT